MAKELTANDKLFIIENRHKMSMNELANHIGTHYQRVRNYMIENNLQLTKDQVQALRIKKYKETRGTADRPAETIEIKDQNYKGPQWTHQPWNRGLNLITML